MNDMELRFVLCKNVVNCRFYIRVFTVESQAVECTDADIESGACVFVGVFPINDKAANTLIQKSGLDAENIVGTVKWERSSEICITSFAIVDG